jgi:Zn-finger nucleic acid-binding protein
MQCPKCARELFEVEQNLVALDCCPGCNGLWFDRGELENIIAIDDVLSKLRAGAPTDLTCPRCAAKTLVEHTSDRAIGVSVERCRDCSGLWLDRGELDAFKQRERSRAPARPPARHAPKPEKLTLKEFLLRFVDASIESLKNG